MKKKKISEINNVRKNTPAKIVNPNILTTFALLIVKHYKFTFTKPSDER